MRRSSAVTIAIALCLVVTGLGPTATSAQAPPAPPRPLDEASMKTDFRALLDRQRILIEKVAATQTPYEDLSREASVLTRDFDGLKAAYTLQLMRHPVDPFVAAVVRTGDSLAALFASWSIAEREGQHAAWLRGELDVVQSTVSADSSGTERALVEQHQHNIAASERNVAEARGHMLASWQVVKQSLAQASVTAP